VPTGLPEGPVPLLVLLHGASSTARNILPIAAREAERHGILVLAPQSRGYSWDVILGGFGPDVAALDELLAQVFDRFPVDPDRVAIGGFSDGASYALSLGLVNGELFRSILAFSPGFVAPGRRQGRPRVFISHGTADTVLPIDRCSRRIVPLLRAEEYDVDYREFRGAHEVPADQVAAAVQLLV
jgi:phospholipase/carboxylesterase